MLEWKNQQEANFSTETPFSPNAESKVMNELGGINQSSSKLVGKPLMLKLTLAGIKWRGAMSLFPLKTILKNPTGHVTGQINRFFARQNKMVERNFHFPRMSILVQWLYFEKESGRVMLLHKTVKIKSLPKQKEYLQSRYNINLRISSL